jgi:hypothetical protein
MELVRFPSHGRFSVRSIFTFVLAAFTTVLLWLLFIPQTAQAQTTTAGWSNDNTILYDNHSFSSVETLPTPSGSIPAGSLLYQSPVQTDQRTGDEKLLVLYFAPGTDPPTATAAKYIEFDHDNGTLSNAQNARDITMTPLGQESTYGGSCSVSGIGWIICPVSVFLADAMDNIFDILANMIKVQPPILGDPNNTMYTAWNVMRAVANVAFVIAFIIIIYAQLTSIGISNYGLKRLVPRLIIAAILVNLSFYVSALAIDISNILGYSLQDIFNGIRENLFHVTDDNLSGINTDITWATVTSIVLAGGGVIGGAYFVSTGGLYLLIPLLLGLFLTVLFVVIVLAARQAIILILVIIAPLAFVANLLPNTEKWFERWRDLFMTMLIFFPAFSLVFGGSQLAGQLIIQNAGDSIISLLFGMAVQIAPLVITPLLLKLSGNLLGRIAQIANDPRKGLLDRNKNWAGERAELQKQKNLQRKVTGNPLSWGAGTAQVFENRRRKRKGLTEAYKQRADNKWHTTNAYGKIHDITDEAELDKQLIEARLKRHTQDNLNNRRSPLHLKNVQVEAGKRALEHSVKLTEATLKEYEAGTFPTGVSKELTDAVSQIQQTRQATSIQGMRAANAETTTQRKLAEALKNDVGLRKVAAGVKPGGLDSVLASATAAVQKADAEDIKNIQDTADVKPGDLEEAAARMVTAIRDGDTIRARAYQNMLVTAGGAGMQKFRETMVKAVDADPSVTLSSDVAEAMRENLLYNHGALKAKSNDLIEWAAKGATSSFTDITFDPKPWAGLSDEDFVLQHPKSQLQAIAAKGVSFTRAETLLDDPILSKKVAPDVRKELNKIAHRAEDAGL